MTVSETVADQCMNYSNSLEALNTNLKLVLARLAPGNPGNLRVYKIGSLKVKSGRTRLRLGIPGSLRGDDIESRTRCI